MIYRFKSAYKPLKGNPRTETSEPGKGFKNKNWHYGRFGGAWAEGCLSLGDLALPKKRINSRAKFYFTEKGYRKYGKDVIASSIEEDQVLQVIKRKNPKKSQIVYEDEYQVAILPEKRKKS